MVGCGLKGSLGGPETHIPNSTISYPALENHIPYPYHIIPTPAFHTHTLFLPGPAFQEDYTFISRQTPGLRLLEDLMFTKRLPMVLISVSAGRRPLFTSWVMTMTRAGFSHKNAKAENKMILFNFWFWMISPYVLPEDAGQMQPEQNDQSRDEMILHYFDYFALSN